MSLDSRIRDVLGEYGRESIEAYAKGFPSREPFINQIKQAFIDEGWHQPKFADLHDAITNEREARAIIVLARCIDALEGYGNASHVVSREQLVRSILENNKTPH